MGAHEQFHLDAEAQRRWKQRLQERRVRSGTQYKSIESDLQALEAGDKKPFLSRFFGGEAASLERAFLQEKWLTIIAKGLNTEQFPCTAEALKADLRWARSGESQIEGEWHPAFPGLVLDAAEIPAPFQGTGGPLQPAAVAREHLLGRGAPPRSWSIPSNFDPLHLVAPAGKARDIAARQLRDALQQVLDALLARAGEEWDEQAAQLTQRHQKPMTERPPTHLPVEIVEGEAQASEGRLLLGVVESTSTHRKVELAPWGSREVRHLAGRLALAPLPATHRKRLAAMAQALEREPGLVDGDWAPDMVIRLLAEVGSSSVEAAHSGARGVRWVRERWTAAAWRRAREAVPHLLADLPESVLEKFFSRAASRRRAPGERGPWWALDESIAVDLLSEVMPAIPLDEIKKRLSEIAKGQKASRAQAVEHLQVGLEGWRPLAMLEALVQAGILERHPTGVRPANRTLAIFWAARGLVRAREPAPAISPERLLDPAWRLLAVELVREGMRWRTLLPGPSAVLDGVAVEAAIWIVNLAAVTRDEAPPDILLPAWATALWAEATGYLHSDTWTFRDRGLCSALEAFSSRYQGALPSFEQDPPAELWAHVPDATKALLNAWRTPPVGDERGPRREPGGPWGLSNFESYEKFARRVIHLAPYQVQPNTLATWDWWQRRDAETCERLLDRLAEAGDESVRAFLSGTLAAAEAARRPWGQAEDDAINPAPMMGMRELLRTRRPLGALELWSRHGLDTRLRWADRWAPEGELAWKVFEVLAAECARREFESHEPPPWLDPLLAIGRKGPPEPRDRWMNWIAGNAHEGIPRDSYMPIALHLAAATGRRDVLEVIESLPRDLGPRTTIDYQCGMPGIAGIHTRMGAPGFGASGDLHYTAGFEKIFHHWEALSLRAAFLLHTVGEPEALRAWATEGRRWAPPEAFWAELERLEGVVRLGHLGFDALMHLARNEDKTLSPTGAALLAAAVSDRERAHEPSPDERHLSVVRHHAACWHEAQPFLGLGLDETIGALVEAVDSFCFRSPPTLPEEVHPLLQQLGSGALAVWTRAGSMSAPPRWTKPLRGSGWREWQARLRTAGVIGGAF